MRGLTLTILLDQPIGLVREHPDLIIGQTGRKLFLRACSL